MRFLTSTLCTTAAITAFAACSSNTATMPSTPGAASAPSQVSPLVTTTRPAEIYNYFQTTSSLPPSYPTPNDFEVNFSGDDVPEICGTGNPPCMQQPLYGVYNPFCPPSNGPSNPCYPTVGYNPTANITTVEYAGPTLNQNVPGHPGMYHFGLFADFADSANQDRLSGCGYWTFNSEPSVRQPFVNVNWNPSVKKSAHWAYAEVYVSVALKSGGSTIAGFWTEVAYVPSSGQPKLTFTNNGTQTLYVTSSGIVPDQNVPTDPDCIKNAACAEDMQILSNLNFNGSPPPGQSGSPFVPLTHPPATALKPQKQSPCQKI